MIFLNKMLALRSFFGRRTTQRRTDNYSAGQPGSNGFSLLSEPSVVSADLIRISPRSMDMHTAPGTQARAKMELPTRSVCSIPPMHVEKSVRQSNTLSLQFGLPTQINSVDSLKNLQNAGPRLVLPWAATDQVLDTLPTDHLKEAIRGFKGQELVTRARESRNPVFMNLHRIILENLKESGFEVDPFLHVADSQSIKAMTDTRLISIEKPDEIPDINDENTYPRYLFHQVAALMDSQSTIAYELVSTAYMAIKKHFMETTPPGMGEYLISLAIARHASAGYAVYNQTFLMSPHRRLTDLKYMRLCKWMFHLFEECIACLHEVEEAWLFQKYKLAQPFPKTTAVAITSGENDIE